MKNFRRHFMLSAMLLSLVAATASSAALAAQERVVVLTGAELSRIVPPGFYFEGQSAPTQMRNSAAARLGAKRHVVAGLVDTSGYSADVRAKYEGFFITDSPVQIEGSPLEPGAYGFGFTDDSQLNIFDVGGRQVLSVNTTSDRVLRRPRPLMMSFTRNELRLYSGRSYAVIAAR